MTIINHRIYLAVIGVLLMIIFLQRACVKPCPGGSVTKVDTIIPPIKPDSTPVYKPKPTNVLYEPSSGTAGDFTLLYTPVPKKVKKPAKPSLNLYLDTSGVRPEEPEINALAGILDTSIVTIYNDTIPVHNAVGNIIVKDTVDGVIRSRQIVHSYSVPIITKTYRPKGRTQIYLGGAIAGIPASPFQYAGISIGLKSKRDQIYSIKALQGLQQGGILYVAEVQTKLSFRPL